MLGMLQVILKRKAYYNLHWSVRHITGHMGVLGILQVIMVC